MRRTAGRGGRKQRGRFVEVRNPGQMRNDEVSAQSHLASDLGVAALVGIKQRKAQRHPKRQQQRTGEYQQQVSGPRTLRRRIGHRPCSDLRMIHPGFLCSLCVGVCDRAGYLAHATP